MRLERFGEQWGDDDYDSESASEKKKISKSDAGYVKRFF